MNRKLAEEHLSEYLEGELAPPEREALEKALAQDPELAREYQEYEKTLKLMHSLPRREPVLDIWMELSPKVERLLAEEKLSVGDRLRLRGTRFLANFAEGAILWTQALAMNTEARMGKYVRPHSLREEA
ncbi:MAG: zf-HC2 domain-containing protein [Armatimonas sp.]